MFFILDASQLSTLLHTLPLYIFCQGWALSWEFHSKNKVSWLKFLENWGTSGTSFINFCSRLVWCVVFMSMPCLLYWMVMWFVARFIMMQMQITVNNNCNSLQTFDLHYQSIIQSPDNTMRKYYWVINDSHILQQDYNCHWVLWEQILVLFFWVCFQSLDEV